MPSSLHELIHVTLVLLSCPFYRWHPKSVRILPEVLQMTEPGFKPGSMALTTT